MTAQMVENFLPALAAGLAGAICGLICSRRRRAQTSGPAGPGPDNPIPLPA
jgi:hypothetical protein